MSSNFIKIFRNYEKFYEEEAERINNEIQQIQDSENDQNSDTENHYHIAQDESEDEKKEEKVFVDEECKKRLHNVSAERE